MPFIKICIKDLLIRNIPTRSNRIFLKLKSGRKSYITKKYKINDNNTVLFESMIVMPINFKKSKSGVKVGQIRFSFRFEKSNGIDFDRYGSFDVTDLDCDEAKTCPYHICRNLERCKEKPLIECNIIVLENAKQSLKSLKETELNDKDQAIVFRNCESDVMLTQEPFDSPSLNDISAKSDPCMHPKKMISDAGKLTNSCFVSSVSYSRSISKTLPLKITDEKYKEIEARIDNLLADIINESSLE